jgi:ankyrin repeat protein
MVSKYELEIRNHIATLTDEEKKFIIMLECMKTSPRLDILEIYINIGLPFDYVSKKGVGIIHVLAKKKDPEIIHMFIKLGADINARNNENETPLHIATSRGNIRTMKTLIDSGADLNLHDKAGYTPLMRACKNEKLVKAMHLLLNSGANIFSSGLPYGRLAGHSIIEENNCRLMRNELFAIGFFSRADQYGMMPIHLAASRGHLDCLKEFKKYDHDLNTQNEINGDTLFHYAVRYGQPEIIKYLYEHGADDSIRNKDGESARELAERMRWPKVIEAMRGTMQHKSTVSNNKQIVSIINREKIMKRNVGTSSKTKSSKQLGGDANEGSTSESYENDMKHYQQIIVSLTSDHSSLQVIRRGLKEIKNYDVKDDEGKTLMHHAAIYKSGKLMMYLIAKNANPHIKDDLNRTPLMYAILSGESYLVEMLMKLGYDIHEIDVMNNSLFVMAHWMEMDALAEKLLMEGADSRGLR